MKKLLFAILICLPMIAGAQVRNRDQVIKKTDGTAPMLHLYGADGYVNFNNGDATLTEIGTDTLQLDGAGLRLTHNDAISLSGNATVWNDLTFASHTLKTVGKTDKPDYDVVGQTLDFPEDTTEAVGFVVQMPHNWKAGSAIYPHVHWLRAAADSVDWTFRYKWVNIGGALPGTWTEKKLSHNTQTYTSGTIQELSRSVDGVGLSGTGKTLSSILIVKFYRNSDPYSGDAKLLQIDIHYEIDKLGSRSEIAE